MVYAQFVSDWLPQIWENRDIIVLMMFKCQICLSHPSISARSSQSTSRLFMLWPQLPRPQGNKRDHRDNWQGCATNNHQDPSNQQMTQPLWYRLATDLIVAQPTDSLIKRFSSQKRFDLQTCQSYLPVRKTSERKSVWSSYYTSIASQIMTNCRVTVRQTGSFILLH